jgi:hypothetical protein
MFDMHRGRHRRGDGDAAARHARQADRLFAFLDFDLGEVGFFEEIDEFLDFAQVHGGPRVRQRESRWSAASSASV